MQADVGLRFFKYLFLGLDDLAQYFLGKFDVIVITNTKLQVKAANVLRGNDFYDITPDFPCECRLTVRAGSLIPFSLQWKGSWPRGYIYTTGLMPRKNTELTSAMNNLQRLVKCCEK